ncbi:translation initiation factor eIF4e [Wallemia mellicola]|nr:translation initiation factor eIF4e [Wallemia mellicola]TIC56856.1 translation initiation factor eIF4e [Wallemia mellicola]
MTLALRTPWTVWGIHRPPSSKIVDYEKDLIKVASFDSVESFWNTYSYLNPPSTLPVVTDYQLFRSGVRPVWEDPENIKGGKWILRLKKGIVDQFWEDLVLAIIGGSIAGGTDDICGAVVSIRAAEDIISVWIKREDPLLIDSVKEEIYKALNQTPANLEMQYKSNSGQSSPRRFLI